MELVINRRSLRDLWDTKNINNRVILYCDIHGGASGSDSEVQS